MVHCICQENLKQYKYCDDHLQMLNSEAICYNIVERFRRHGVQTNESRCFKKLAFY